MLNWIKLHNFKSYLNMTIVFGLRHLLIGKNNSGKTSLAKAMHFLSKTASADLNTAGEILPGGVQEALSWLTKIDTFELTIQADLHFENEIHNFTYHLSLRVTRGLGDEAALRVAQERLTVLAPSFREATLIDNDGRESRLLHEEQHAEGFHQPHTPKTLSPRDATMLSKLYETGTNRRAIAFRRYLQNWHYFAFDPELIRTGAKSTNENLFLAPGGENLAYIIFQLKNAEELRYRRLLEHARELEPGLEAINFIAAPGQSPVPFVVHKSKPRASWSGLSDGTLRWLAMASVCDMWSDRDATPGLAILEEPENAIAPLYLRRLYELFEIGSPSGQFIFTSHSPYFIDMWNSDRASVSVLRRTEDGRTEEQHPPQDSRTAPVDERMTLSERYATELIG